MSTKKTKPETPAPRIIFEMILPDARPYECEARVVLYFDEGDNFPSLIVEAKEKDAMGDWYWSPVKAASQKSKFLEMALMSKEGVDVVQLIKDHRLP